MAAIAKYTRPFSGLWSSPLIIVNNKQNCTRIILVRLPGSNILGKGRVFMGSLVEGSYYVGRNGVV